MNGLAVTRGDLGRHADAVELYEETLAVQKTKLSLDHPDSFQTMYNLAISYAELGRHADALELREEALALHRARLGPDHPRTLASMNSVACSYATVGRHADAVKVYEELLSLQKTSLVPEHPQMLQTMRSLAECLVKINRGAEAVTVIDECVRQAVGKDVDPRLLPRVMILRLRHFEKTGDAAGCWQTAVLWENLKRTDTASLYNAACMRAVSAAVFRATDNSPGGRKQADTEADRAMVWLKRAVAAGYQNAAHLMRDRDLDALRDRADFTKLGAQMQARPPEEKPSAARGGEGERCRKKSPLHPVLFDFCP
jgi:tetratricopeptide (TPR) repeat protein